MVREIFLPEENLDLIVLLIALYLLLIFYNFGDFHFLIRHHEQFYVEVIYSHSLHLFTCVVCVRAQYRIILNLKLRCKNSRICPEVNQYESSIGQEKSHSNALYLHRVTGLLYFSGEEHQLCNK